MFKKRQAVVRTKKYGKLIRFSVIFAIIAAVSGGIAYAWQQYEEAKYPEGTELDYSLPDAFIEFAGLINDFMTQDEEEEAPSEENETHEEEEKDVFIVVGDDPADIPPELEPEDEPEPEIRGGIVPEGESEGYYSFKDSLFIGDYFISQAEYFGYFEYTDFAYTTEYDMNSLLTKKAFRNEEEYLTLADYSGTFSEAEAVYLFFSAESISWMDCTTFVKKYTAFLDEIISVHPEAHIYVQTILPINEEKAAKRGYSVTNEKINEINGYIRSAAEGRSVWILDIAESFKNKEGFLPAEMTTNGIRLEKEAYEQWADYIVTHKAH